jgi:hypothetical protein
MDAVGNVHGCTCACVRACVCFEGQLLRGQGIDLAVQETRERKHGVASREAVECIAVSGWGAAISHYENGNRSLAEGFCLRWRRRGGAGAGGDVMREGARVQGAEGS